MKAHELWRKLMRVAECAGSSGFDDTTSHYHLGIEFKKNLHEDYSAESSLKTMVVYQQGQADKCSKRAVEVDAAAWYALMGFEEVRTVGKPGFALTTTYNGWCGDRRDSHSTHNAHETFKEWLIEFEE